jgi:diadenosine tetraphosphatase ApaH/serine/threonine PP2A family protein phosphatase
VRILLISDVHANLEALEAVLAAAPAHIAVWNLGDLVGYGASPNEVVERLIPLQNVAVRGNHDKAASGITDLSDFNPIAAAALVWTRNQLIATSRLALRQLARGPVLPSEGVACAHGSPLDEDHYIHSRREAWHPLAESPARITFFGHTHIQGGYQLEEQHCTSLKPNYHGGVEREVVTLALDSSHRYLLNPGSVGQPRDNDWRAAFALFDLSSMQLEWHRIPYNVELAQRRIREAGLPERLAARLASGR